MLFQEALEVAQGAQAINPGRALGMRCGQRDGGDILRRALRRASHPQFAPVGAQRDQHLVDIARGLGDQPRPKLFCHHRLRIVHPLHIMIGRLVPFVEQGVEGVPQARLLLRAQR